MRQLVDKIRNHPHLRLGLKMVMLKRIGIWK